MNDRLKMARRIRFALHRGHTKDFDDIWGGYPERPCGRAFGGILGEGRADQQDPRGLIAGIKDNARLGGIVGIAQIKLIRDAADHRDRFVEVNGGRTTANRAAPRHAPPWERVEKRNRSCSCRTAATSREQSISRVRFSSRRRFSSNCSARMIRLGFVTPRISRLFLCTSPGQFSMVGQSMTSCLKPSSSLA